MVELNSDNQINKYTKEIRIYKKLLLLILVMAASIVVVAISLSLRLLFIEKSNHENAIYDLPRMGAWGDMFGGFLNPILAFLALIALFITIRLQAIELSRTAQELKGSKEATENLVNAQTQQNIENSFFQLLALKSDYVESLKVRHVNREYEKINFFKVPYLVFIRGTWPNELTSNDIVESVRSRYEAQIDQVFGDMLRTYFRLVYNIFRYLDEKTQELGDENTKTYARIARASLSDNELWLIFLSALTDRGNGFIQYIEKYHLFDNLNFDFLQDTQPVTDRIAAQGNHVVRELLAQFDDSAYGAQADIIRERWPLANEQAAN